MVDSFVTCSFFCSNPSLVLFDQRINIDTAEVAFNPNVLVDILIQMNAHSKKCALDIQAYQRSLALRMKNLDDYTAEAVQDLIAVQQQAKSHADQLLSGKKQIRKQQATVWMELL